jgi:hypothetical protein
MAKSNKAPIKSIKLLINLTIWPQTARAIIHLRQYHEQYKQWMFR